jgi:hypothetical protein
MYAVNEGDEECFKCKHLDCSVGCVYPLTGELPPCGRNVILTQKEFRKLKEGKNEKRHIFKFM